MRFPATFDGVLAFGAEAVVVPGSRKKSIRITGIHIGNVTAGVLQGYFRFGSPNATIALGMPFHYHFFVPAGNSYNIGTDWIGEAGFSFILNSQSGGNNNFTVTVIAEYVNPVTRQVIEQEWDESVKKFFEKQVQQSTGFSPTSVTTPPSPAGGGGGGGGG